MMMPFVRLLAIYALVGAAIFAFLKRDELMAYFSEPESGIVVAAAPPAQAPTPAPVVAANPAPAPVDPTPVIEAQSPVEAIAPAQNNAAAKPRFGSDITPQYFGHNNASNTAAPAPRARANDLVPRWTKAREVYNQGNIAEASQLYEALTASFPNNADLHGEAGNLYYNIGRFDQASTHYFAVGQISVRTGNSAMATAMHGVLMRIAPNKAAELQAMINAAR